MPPKSERNIHQNITYCSCSSWQVFEQLLKLKESNVYQTNAATQTKKFCASRRLSTLCIIHFTPPAFSLVQTAGLQGKQPRWIKPFAEADSTSLTSFHRHQAMPLQSMAWLTLQCGDSSTQYLDAMFTGCTKKRRFPTSVLSCMKPQVQPDAELTLGAGSRGFWLVY